MFCFVPFSFFYSFFYSSSFFFCSSFFFLFFFPCALFPPDHRSNTSPLVDPSPGGPLPIRVTALQVGRSFFKRNSCSCLHCCHLQVVALSCEKRFPPPLMADCSSVGLCFFSRPLLGFYPPLLRSLQGLNCSFCLFTRGVARFQIWNRRGFSTVTVFAAHEEKLGLMSRPEPDAFPPYIFFF